MTIIEAINEVFPASPKKPPFITRKKWSHPTSRPDGGVKIMPTNSVDCMIVFSEANGKQDPHRGWEPTAEDLIADDWAVTW